MKMCKKAEKEGVNTYVLYQKGLIEVIGFRFKAGRGEIIQIGHFGIN